MRLHRRIMALACGLGVIAVAAVVFQAIHGLVFGITEYAPGFHEEKFQQIRIGDSEAHVIATLGLPFCEHAANPQSLRYYGPVGSFVDELGGIRVPQEADWSGVIVGFDPQSRLATSGPAEVIGKSEADADLIIGVCIKSTNCRATRYLVYSRSPNSGNYHRRWVGLDAQGEVAELVSLYYVD